MLIDNFIAASNEVANTQQLLIFWYQAMGKLGFDRLLFSLLMDHKTIARKAGPVIAFNYPPEWLEHYSRNDYKKIDPVYHHMFITKGAFTWESLRTSAKSAQPQMAFLNMAREAGLNSGVGIPLRGPAGELAAVRAACSAPGIKWRPETLDYAALLCEQFYKSYLRLEKKAGVVKVVRLTDRERQVLVLCARGHSQTAIAMSMNLSPNTVKHHLKGVLHKLEADNQKVAVLKAAAMGLITAST